LKRIISILTVVMLVVSMFSITAMAADPKTMTIALLADKANAGDEITVNAVLASTVEVKDMQVYIEFDPADFELGTSDAADDLYAEYGEYVGTEDYPTLDDLCKDQLGVASYVDTAYYDAYSALKDTKKWGSPAIGAEVKDGMMNVMFSYMKTGAISKLNNTNDLSVGGAVLKVATAEQKQSVISVKKSFTTYDTSGTKLNVVSEDVVVNLNGYGEVVEPEVPTAADLGLFTDATQNAKVTEKVMTSNGYSIEKALLFVSGINNDAAVVAYGTEITCEGFDKPLDIPCANYYAASETVKGFVAAVSSIRNTNLTKTFTARAYADVTVGEKTERIYATDAATAVYGN